VTRTTRAPTLLAAWLVAGSAGLLALGIAVGSMGWAPCWT